MRFQSPRSILLEGIDENEQLGADIMLGFRVLEQPVVFLYKLSAFELLPASRVVASFALSNLEAVIVGSRGVS